MYHPWRFRTIVLLMILFGAFGISAVLHHHFPLSFGALERIQRRVDLALSAVTKEISAAKRRLRRR